MKYLVKVHLQKEIEAGDDVEAIDKFFIELEDGSNDTIITKFRDITTAKPVEDRYDRVSQEPLSAEDAEDRAVEEGYCPRCDVKLVTKMFDIDGTNLEEHVVCPMCGYGTPALR